MQIKTGQAKVLSTNLRRVQFTGLAASDAALLAANQFFTFQGENLFFTVTSVISAVQATAEIELVAPGYNGSKPADTLANYLIWKDFTPLHGFMLFAPGDVDIRGGMSYNANLTDTLIGTGGGGGSGFTKQGIASFTTGASSKTVTPASGSFPTPPYGIVLTPYFPAQVWVRTGSLTTGQFIVDMQMQAPTPADFFWGVSSLI